jgi:hypothetical protein
MREELISKIPHKLNTTDIYLTAYLITNAILPEKTIKEGRKVIFQFTKDKVLINLETNFREGRAIANIRKYKGSLEYARELLFSRLRNN